MSTSTIESIYIHVPFCERKCTYCDFYSIESTQHIDSYVDAVIQEIGLRRSHLPEPLSPHTIFFGGGTPTLLSPLQIQRILDAFPPVREGAEVTMEANPGTVSLERLQAYRALGVNRLSIGVQSFQAPELEFLTRIHSAQQASEAIAMARTAGFENVNMDIMFALPNQTIASLTDTLQRVIDLAPDHVSAYSLIYEHGTPLYRDLIRERVHPVGDDDDAEMYELVTTRLADAGYMQYEVSNFAQTGKECRHNLAYWHARDHLSVGPSAHGLVNGERYWNHRSLTSWRQLIEAGSLPQANTERLSEEERFQELIFLTLRADGLPLLRITQEFNVDVRSLLAEHLAYWIAEGRVVDHGDRLQLTARGYAICDELTVFVLRTLPGS